MAKKTKVESESVPVTVPVKVVKHRPAPKGAATKIAVKVEESPKPQRIYVETPVLDAVEAERARRRHRKARNLSISASVLLVLLLSGGVVYT